MFASMSHSMYQIVVGCLCVFAGSIFFLSSHHGCSGQLIFMSMFYGTDLILDHFFTWYEKFMIAQERSGIVCLISLASLSATAVFVYWSSAFSPITCAVGFLLLRFAACIAISIAAFLLWRLKPTLPALPRAITYPLIAFFIAFSTWALIIK